MTAEGSGRWFKRHPKKFMALLLAALFLLLDFSLGYFLCPKTVGQPDAYYHHDLPKNFDGPRDWGDREYRLVTNSLGFKDSADRQVAREGAGYRILFLGDSFTEGVGFPYEETFAGIFAAAAAREGIEVLNAGVVSYSPKLYYLKTRYLLQNLHLKFDELIVFLDYTDIQDEIRYEAFVPSAEFGLSRYYLVNRLDAFLKQRSLTYWKARGLILEQTGHFDDELFTTESEENLLIYDQEFVDNWAIERNQWEYNQRVYAKWGKRGVELALKHMDSLCQLCREHGVRLKIAVYPWPNQIKRQDLGSKQVQIWEAFCAEGGLDFINYYPTFIDGSEPRSVVEKYFIPGDVHWNREGHQRVAEVLLERHAASRAGTEKVRPKQSL
jgi:lysophospholipase L1-like esterase